MIWRMETRLGGGKDVRGKQDLACTGDRYKCLLPDPTDISRIGRHRKLTYVDWANEVLVTHEDVGHAYSENDCQYPSTNESFYRLLWR